MSDMLTWPFFAGLAAALLLPALGNLLRLRDEWLAALGLAHLATASALLGMAVALPPIWGAPLGAVAGALGKHFSGCRSNSAYAVMILGGWSLALLLAANTALGGALAHALIDGQLYFAGGRELLVNLALLVLLAASWRWLAPRLIRARLFPQFERANRLPAWRWHLAFELLVALAIAAATATLGLMATFALLFVPAAMAFAQAPDWRRAFWLAEGLALAGYLLAFFVALIGDQPFGPVLGVVLLLLFAGLMLARRWLGRARRAFQST